VSGGVDGRQRGELTLSDLKTGACLRTYPDADRRWIAQLAPLPDGKRFLSACAWDNDVKLWALDRAQPLRVFSGHQVDPKNSVLAVAASTDGSVAVSGALDGSIKLWNVETGECVRTFSGSSGEVRAVAMASRADRIVSGTTAGDVDVWELGTGRIVRTLRGHAGPVRHVAVTSDGRWIVSGGQDPTVNIWDARSGTLHASIARGLRSCDAIALSMDERCVYVASAARVDKILIANGSQRVVWDPEPPISEAFEQ
jgi:WD40 repeat protein